MTGQDRTRQETGKHGMKQKQQQQGDLQQQQQQPSHNKPCTLCNTPRPVLVRCQIDDTGKWHFVCPGKCWTSVSGGEIDAKGHRDEFPYYRYGGMWKNRHEDGPLHAKKPKNKKKTQKKKEVKQNHPGINEKSQGLSEEEDDDDDSLEDGHSDLESKEHDHAQQTMC